MIYGPERNGVIQLIFNRPFMHILPISIARERDIHIEYAACSCMLGCLMAARFIYTVVIEAFIVQKLKKTKKKAQIIFMIPVVTLLLNQPLW